ncbi:unnamed protein product [Parajaminaea phylloscopi]
MQAFVDAADEEDEAEQDEELRVPKVKKLPLNDKAKNLLKSMTQSEMHKKGDDLVRLFLFSEYRKQPVKREDITKLILGKGATRAFPYVYNRAQRLLRNIFCYEMVELRAKGVEPEQLAATQAKGTGKRKDRDDDDDEDGSAATSTGSRTYVLRSILPQPVIEAMTQSHAASFGSNASQSRADASEYQGNGPMLDWTKADGQLGSMGLTYLILSFILLNGRSLPDVQFRAYMNRLSLGSASQLPSSMRPDSWDASKSRATVRSRGNQDSGHIDTVARPSTLAKFVDQLQKQQYLEAVRTNVLTGATQRRGRASNANDGERSEVEWRWGPRAEAEIGEVAVANFVSAIYVDGESEGGDEVNNNDGEASVDLSQPQRRSQSARGIRSRTSTQNQRGATAGTFQSQREKQTQALRKDIERAAGSQLME